MAIRGYLLAVVGGMMGWMSERQKRPQRESEFDDIRTLSRLGLAY